MNISQCGLSVNQLSWIVDENKLCNGSASHWLRSPSLAPILKNLSEEAASSQGIVNAWDVLSSGFDIASDGGNFLPTNSYFYQSKGSNKSIPVLSFILSKICRSCILPQCFGRSTEYYFVPFGGFMAL